MSKHVTTLRRVRAALPVLQTMLTKAGLLQGAAIAGEHLNDLDAAIAALAAPAGGEWVMVPREPTPEMLACIARSEWPQDWEAGKRLQREAGCEVVFPKTEIECAVGQYQRMLAAAPQPAQAGASGGGVPFGYYIETLPPKAWAGTFTRAPEIAAMQEAAASGRVKVTPLYTTPRAAEAVTDALRKLRPFWAQVGFNSVRVYDANEVEAALTPPSAKGENGRE